MDKIAIIGYGHVGKLMHQIFPHALIYDPNYEEYKDTKDQINKECDLAIICVWTGSNEDGSCDISIVDQSVKWLETDLILIKSALAPGTVDKLKRRYKKRICISPEYFGESKYWLPYEQTLEGWPFMIIGGEDKDATEILDIFVPVLGPNKKYFICTALEAEIIKYMENTWSAVKVIFSNEMYEICKSMGANWYRVWEGWALDPRVERSTTAVFVNKRGFGGKCLPKDVLALIRSSQKNGYEPNFLKQILKSNAVFRGEKDPIEK